MKKKGKGLKTKQRCREGTFCIKRRGGIKSAGAVLLSIAAGGANALFGGGGGMLVVPALKGCLELEERKAHATAIGVMMPLSLVSAIALTAKGVYDVSLALFVGLGAMIGGAIGALFLKRIPKKFLTALFYCVMIYAGIKFLR